MIKDINFNYLKFTKELNELLYKYKVDIYAKCDYELGFYGEDGIMYELDKDINSNEYKLLYYNSDLDENINVKSEYIKRLIPHNFKNRVKTNDILIFSKDKTKINNLMNNIIKNNKDIIKKVVQNFHEIKRIELFNGIRYVNMINNFNNKGYRFSKVYVDINLDLDAIKEISKKSICSSKEDIIIF